MTMSGRGTTTQSARGETEWATHPWTRWFRRRVENGSDMPSALGDSYLSEQETYYSTIYQLSKLEAVDAASCVVLLGESGLGKSHVMREWSLLAQEDDPDSVITSKLSLLGSLREFSDDLEQKLQSAGASPVIFIDGLEEAAYADKICSKLSDLFSGRCPPRLRLAVRSAAWRCDFQDALAAIWKDELAIFELCPLLRIDVTASLERARGSSSISHSIDDLESAGAAPLLARPVTLLMILELIRTGDLPSPLTRRSLYERGMRKLVERRNRQAHDDSTRFPIDERLAAGRRLAAVTVFCARPLLRLSCDEAEHAERLHIDQLVDGSGELKDEPKDDTGSRTGPISVALLDDVCRETGLFRVDTDAVTWVHASFAEFLASEYVRLRKVPLAQLRLVLGLASGNPVPRQLEGVLSWLAGGFPELRKELLRQQPESMLQTGDLTANECERMVDHFLQEIADGQTEHLSFDVQHRARSLRHPGIADQLRRWLASRDHSQVIYGVLALVLAIGVRELMEELLALVFDFAQPERVRHVATRCVRDHGGPEEQARLAPLLEPSSADPSDNLRGCALSALWPKQLTTEQLFAALTPPKRQNFTGSYQIFIHRLIEEVTAEQLPVALPWARQQPAAAAGAWPVDLVTAIVGVALQSPNVGSLLEPVLDILVAYYGAFHSLEGLIKAPLPVAVRRALVAEQVNRLSSGESTPHSGNSAGERILTDAGFIASGLVIADQDLLWLVEQSRRAGSPTSSSWWLRLLCAAVRDQASPIPDHVFDGLYLLCSEQPTLRDSGGCLAEFFAVELTDDRWRKEQAGLEILRQRASDDQQRRDRLACQQQFRLAAIDAFASGAESEPTFIRAAMPLCMGPAAEWANAAEARQSLPSDRALEWLRRACATKQSPPVYANPEDLAWCLAVVAAADRIDEVAPETWRGILTAADEPLSWLQGWQQPDPKVRDQVLLHGAATLTAWITETNLSAAQMDLLLTLLPWDRAWPATTLQAFLDNVRSKADSAQLPLLEALPPIHFAVAAPLLQALAAPPSEAEIRLQAQMMMVGSDHEDSKAWVIQRLFQEPGNPDGRALAEKFVSFHQRRSIELPIKPLLSPALAATVYPWLLREYPPVEDPSTEPHQDGGRYHAGRFRDIARNCLRVGDPAEVKAALESVLAVNAEDAYLQGHLHRVRREQPWRAPALAEWLALMRNHERRWVSDQAGLVAVVMESIARFAGYLQGENAEAESLWNDSVPKEGKDGIQTPKREEALSNALARHLRRDLQDRKVIVYREVEIRAGKNSRMGPKVDLSVDAVSTTEKALQLLIEVKRCRGDKWNDIQGQLVDRYLKPMQCAGIFLVGRYDCGCGVCKTYSLPDMEAELRNALSKIPEHPIQTIVLDCSFSPGRQS